MKSLLTKFAFQKAIGLCLGEHEIAVSKVAATVFGPIEVASATAPYGSGDLVEVLDKLLSPLLGKKRRRVPLAVGLGGSRIFFGTRLNTDAQSSAPKTVLQKALASPNISVDDLSVDVLKSEVNKTPVVSVAACREKYLERVITTLEEFGIRLVRAEPSPCALARLAAWRFRAPRRTKSVLRMFLGRGMGLAVAVVADQPVAWRNFVLTEGEEGTAVISAARALQAQYKLHGIDLKPGYVMIHGLPEIHERLRQEQFPTKMGTRIIWCDSPGLNESSMALGLAAGCLNPDLKAFDLSHSMKSRPPIMEIFPWADLAFSILLVAGMGVAAYFHAEKVDAACAAVRLQSSRYKSLASLDAKTLDAEIKDLTKKAESARNFAESRNAWTEYLDDLAARLPADAVLKRLSGSWALNTRGKATVKKAFNFEAVVAMPVRGAAPREVDDFIRVLRSNSVLKRDFETVELTGLKQNLSQKGPSTVSLNVICKPSKGGDKSAGKKAK